MTFKSDLSDDIASTIYDSDEFAESATHTPKSTGVEGASFSCFIGDSILHGDSRSEEVSNELIEMTAATTDISGIKEFDTITSNSINYEVAGPSVVDSAISGISFATLRRKLNDQTRV